MSRGGCGPVRIVKPSYEILTPISEGGKAELQFIERCGRTAYKSEDKITDGSAERFVASIIKRGHESVLEHSMLTVKFICDRGVSHELVRHRLCSFTQESQRYCNYSGDKFGNELTFIEPCFFEEDEHKKACWWCDMRKVQDTYLRLLEYYASPEEARAVLPNSVKTEIVVTANYREWRNIFKLRCDKAAHPSMRELMIPLLKELQSKIPVIFDDIEVKE